MVDRITPVTSADDVEAFAIRTGVADAAPVFCETFSQWVIEDQFPTGRPAWERVGAQFVDDVAPYEFMKLRLLNGSHLAVSGLGRLAGYATIDKCMADPRIAAIMRSLMDHETGPTLTSGVLFATIDSFRPYPQSAVHAFCHALPGLWHQMGVTLSAAASLSWWARITGSDEATLLAEVGQVAAPSPTLFLPYLAGERTPHNDGAVRGTFAGLAADTDRAAITQAVLEGVAFSMRDCLDALRASGTQVVAADVIGGGSRSPEWVRILAAVLDLPLRRFAEGEHGGAFGAARLARLAVTAEDAVTVCKPPQRYDAVEPDPSFTAAYIARLANYRALYRT